MRLLKFAGLLLCSICFIAKGDAQTPTISRKSVWEMESIQVRPGMMGLTLGYLDEHWMRLRQEAKRKGVVLSYHRFTEPLLIIPGSKSSSQDRIVLLTEYTDLGAFSGRDLIFSQIEQKLPSSSSGVVTVNRGELYETVDTGVFMEEPANPSSPEFKLVAKQ